MSRCAAMQRWRSWRCCSECSLQRQVEPVHGNRNARRIQSRTEPTPALNGNAPTWLSAASAFALPDSKYLARISPLSARQELYFVCCDSYLHNS